MKKQEQTRQTELSSEKAHFQAQQAHADIVSCFPSLNFRHFTLLFVKTSITTVTYIELKVVKLLCEINQTVHLDV